MLLTVDEHGLPFNPTLSGVDPVVDFGDDEVVIPNHARGREVCFIVSIDVKAVGPASAVRRSVAGRGSLHEIPRSQVGEGGIMILRRKGRRHGISQSN